MIFNIQRYSTHDGPVIRTVVFLKGCSLGCAGARTRRAAPVAKICCMTRGCACPAASCASRRRRRLSPAPSMA